MSVLSRPCAVVDLSSNNGATVDFRRLAAAEVNGYPVKAVLLKASEGATVTDPYFQTWRGQAVSAGLHVGAYHFAYPTDTHDWYDEAHHFAHVVHQVVRGDLRPCLDFERALQGDVVAPWFGGWAREWTRAVKTLLGSGPLFYSFPAFVLRMQLKSPVGYGLWLAAYGPDDGHLHPAYPPPPWRHYVLHQYTSKGAVDGVPGKVDISFAPKGLRPLLA